MSELITYRLDEIADVIDCEHKTAPKVDSSEYYSIRTPDIKNGRLLYEQANRVSAETYELWTKRGIPEAGDIILAREAPVGEVGWIDKDHKICLGQRTVLIKIRSSQIEKKYLLYSFVSPKFKDYLNELSGGSVVAHLNMKDIRALEFSFPPLPEQKAIASVLSSLDDKIDLLHRQNKTLEAMAETLFRQWFIEEAKEDWGEVKLGDLCDIITKGTTPKQFTESGVNFIKAESLTDTGSFIRSKFASVSNEIHEGVLKRSILKIDDVLFSIAGTIGRVAKVTEDILPANTNQALAILRPNRGVNSDLIYCILKSVHFQELADGKIVHAVQPNLSLGEISNTCIRLPSESVLKAFTNQVSTYFDKKHANTKQNPNTRKLKRHASTKANEW